LISRYEEYSDEGSDQHGRYPHMHSTAYKFNFIQQPLVNLWLKEFKNLLQQKFSSIEFSTQPFRFLPTYDVDIAYQYKGAGLKNIFSSIKHLFRFHFKEISAQFKVLFNTKKDPYDVFDWLEHLHQVHHIQPVYFFLAGHSSRIDKNVPLRAMKGLIKKLSAKNKIALHPSGGSSVYERQLLNEKLRLERIIDHTIIDSRQHYLKLKLPSTYRNLVGLGFEREYSMGYSSINGFRASFCEPFNWFDLKRNETTELVIYPFCYMDSTSIFSLKHSPEQALNEMLNIYKTIRSVDGMMITILHNHFLSEQPAWIGWRDTWEQFFKKITSSSASYNSPGTHHKVLQDSLQ
jgi:hypothetical protein